VSITVDLPASGTVDSVEPLVVEAGQRAMRAAVQAACREYERQVQACITCDSALLQSHGTDERQLRTSFGRVRLHLRRLRCEACGRQFRPAEPFVARLAGGTVRARLRDACVLAGSSWPYATAATVLRGLCGAEISAEWIRQLTTTAGTTEAHTQSETAIRLVTASATTVRAERSAARTTSAAPPSPAPVRLLVGWDGGWVPSRDQPGGMEGKVGVVATDTEPVGTQGRQRLVRRRYVATFGDSERVGMLTYAAAHRLGGEQAERQTVLGDGADWTKTQAALHFPDATPILDWPHLARIVHKAIRAARSGATHRQVRRRAHRQIPALLWTGAIEAATTALADLRPASTEPIAALDAALTYLATQRDWIGDYGAWRDAGEPVGSGLVEREVALVINRRMKRQGMRWRRANADALVALRVRTINDTWDQQAACPPILGGTLPARRGGFDE
jgi:hypothetical protein